MKLLRLTLVAALATAPLALAEGTDPHSGHSMDAKATTAAPAPNKAQPASSGSLANAVVARTPEEEAAQSGFSIVTILDHWLGMGTFVDARYYSSLAVNLNLMPRYQFTVKGVHLAASATARMVYEYTMPDVETGRRWAFYDTSVGLSAPVLFKEKISGIGITPGLGLTIPTSPESWNAGLITGVSLSLSFSRSVKTFDFSAAVSGRRSFYARDANVYAPANPNARDQYGNLLAVCRAGESACAFNGMNGTWGASATANVAWRVTGDVMLYAGYSFIKGWKSAASTGPSDPLNPQALDSNGNPVARVGEGQTDRTFGVFGASYQLNEHYSLDLSMTTIQTPLTATGQVRFPFFSFGSMADNTTSANFTISAGY